jgi:hypothetical protein
MPVTICAVTCSCRNNAPHSTPNTGMTKATGQSRGADPGDEPVMQQVGAGRTTIAKAAASQSVRGGTAAGHSHKPSGATSTVGPACRRRRQHHGLAGKMALAVMRGASVTGRRA